MLTKKKDDKAALCFILGAMMSGSCNKKQQAKNTRSLRIFYEALKGLEEKNNKKYAYTSIVAEYLGVE